MKDEKFHDDIVVEFVSGSVNPTIGKNYLTGKSAEQMFENWLPESWLPRKQDPDVFLDYVVEIVEYGEPTGRQLGAQIKGTHSPTLKYPIKTKQLRYWLRDVQHPVFLFLIDVQKEAGHWLFVQKYANEHITKASLEKQRKITVHFSPEDTLENKTRFLSALEAAEKCVRDLHPSSVEAALGKERREYETEEPRFAYDISVQHGKKTIHISAREPVSLKFEFTGENAQRAFAKALEDGSELKLPAGAVKLTGSPIFEKFNAPEGHLVIRFGLDAPGQLVLSYDGSIMSRPFALNGTYRIGTKTLVFQSQLPDAPIAVRCTLNLVGGPSEPGKGLEFCYTARKWEGMPVLFLPYFEEVFNILESAEVGRRAQLRYIIRGVTVAEGTQDDSKTGETHNLFQFVQWLARLRTVAKHYGINPTLPALETIAEEQWELVDDLLAILSGQKRVIPMPNLSARCTLSMNPDSEIKEAMVGCLRIDNPNGNLHLLGTPLSVGPVRFFFTNTRIAPATRFLDGKQMLELKGTNSTQRWFQKY